eukprot:COSAG02_NODE_53040_length_304_cov_0.751220_1_plen_29_part_01
MAWTVGRRLQPPRLYTNIAVSQALDNLAL